MRKQVWIYFKQAWQTATDTGCFPAKEDARTLTFSHTYCTFTPAVVEDGVTDFLKKKQNLKYKVADLTS